MAVETGQAVRAAIYTRVTGDATIKSVYGQSGTVFMYRVMAPQDPAFPYLVDRVSLDGDLFYGTHTYMLDLWDYNESPTRIDSAVDRLKVLLHEWTFTTASDEAVGFMEWFSGGYIPTDAEKVWHYATQWSMRFGAARDTTNIVG